MKSVQGILGNEGLDYLYNNAGINPGIDDAFEFDHASFLKTLETNVAAPALISQVYLPLLEKGRRKVIVNVTSGLAGFALQSKVQHAGNFSRYIISKTALNMLTYKQARARPDIIAIVLAPGWTKTGQRLGWREGAGGGARERDCTDQDCDGVDAQRFRKVASSRQSHWTPPEKGPLPGIH